MIGVKEEVALKMYGQIIAKLRKEKGYTQEQLGKQLNVSYQAVSKWENNLSEPDLGTLEKLVKIFDITMSEFFAMANRAETFDQQIERNVIKVQEEGMQTKLQENAVLNNKDLKFNLQKIAKTKPWYVVAGLGILVAVVAFFAILIPTKYSGEKIYNSINPSVFYVTTYNSNDYASTSSGFFVNISGLAVTTYSVVKNAVRGEITLDNQTYQIERLVKIDEKLDLALIKINIDWSPTVKLGNSNSVGLADKVYAIGSKAKNETYLSESLISKISYSGDYKYFQLLTTSVTNGSVLVNEIGRVVGVFTWAFYGDAGMDTAVPINAINQMPKNINMSLEEFQNAKKTFSFYSNGELIETKAFITGDKITKIQDPTREGYSFGGWYTSEDYQTEFDFNSPVFDQTECYAKWIPNTYTIKFESNGGTGTMQDIIVNYDQELSLPTITIEKPHYKLAKWQQKDTETFFDDNQTIKNLTTENNAVIVLCAIWEEISYTIVFDGNGATGGEMEDFVLQWGQSKQLPNNLFYKTGYELHGWLYNGITYSETYVMYNLCETETTVTFVAQWKPIIYTITFVSIYGSSYEQKIQYDEKVRLLPNRFEKENYHLAYWSCEEIGRDFGDEQEVLNLTTNSHLYFIANFRENYYFIRYNDYYMNQEPTISKQQINYSEEAKISGGGYRQGYKFVHWVDANNNIYNINDRVVGLVTGVGEYFDLYAQWEEITYTAYYKYELKNETKYTLIGTKTYLEEFVLSEPEYVDDGYEFTHWKIFLQTYSINQTVSKLTGTNLNKVHIIAQYQPKQYTINFDGNEATEGNMSPITATFDSEVIVPENTFIKDGYSFLGWEYDGKIYNTTNIGVLITTYKENITLTAQWVQNLKGEGTVENPYTISTLEDINDFAILSTIDTFADKYVILTNDINCEYAKLDPIYFAGYFDGQGYKIYNVDYASSALFAVNEGTIKNLGIENLKVERVYQDNTNTEIVAGLVHTNKGGTISKCYVQGSIKVTNQADIYVAGLAYHNNNHTGVIEYCYTDLVLDVNATTDISNCYVLGFVAIATYKGLRFNYSLVDISVNTQNVEKLYVNAFVNWAEEATFAKANVVVNATGATKYSFGQYVQYYTDDSQVNVTINEQDITGLITKTASTSNLQNETWNENNCFNVTGVWVYNDGEFPKPNSQIKTIEINSQEEFLTLNNKVLLNNYVLNCDIDLTNISFKILENYGVFDGNGHIISNLNIVTTNKQGLYGLFGKNSGKIKNLGLSDLNINLYIEGDNNTIGGIVAENNGVVTACFAKGNITISHLGSICYIGGIAGLSYNLISNCYVDADMTGTNNNGICVGGICSSGESQIINCYTKGNYKSTCITSSASCKTYGITTSLESLVKYCFSVANVEIKTNYSYSDYRNAGFISYRNTNCYQYMGQVKTRTYGETTFVEYPESGSKSLSTLSSKAFLQSIYFQEFTTKENLTENENAVWLITETELPKLWFEL